MGVEGCTKCIKYLLFVFNFIFWVSPSAVGVVGLRALLEPGFFHSFCPPLPPPTSPHVELCTLLSGLWSAGHGEHLSFAIFYACKRSFIYFCIYSYGTSIYTRVDGCIFTSVDLRTRAGVRLAVFFPRTPCGVSVAEGWIG